MRWCLQILRFPRSEREPAGSAALGIDLGAPYQITLADDANQVSAVCNNGHGTDAILEQGLGGILHGAFRAHGNDRGDHDISGFHIATPVNFQRLPLIEPASPKAHLSTAADADIDLNQNRIRAPRRRLDLPPAREDAARVSANPDRL